jgi:alpha-tubulin suppressor-like RCC1 family protein
VLLAWGDNAYGQLGDGTTTYRVRPERIILAPGVRPTAISAGGDFSLAIGSDGRLFAWGNNAYGQLGDGTITGRVQPEPIVLSPGVRPTLISAGYDANLAVGSDGDLYVWGANLHGQLGDGTTILRARPEPIKLGSGALPLRISAGALASLAISSNRVLYSWGDNCCGQVGDGTRTDRLRPEPIRLAPGVSPDAVSAGGEGLAIGSDGALYAWGPNPPLGQMGDGTTGDYPSPEEMFLAPGVAPKTISAGQGGLAIGSDGKLYGWGVNAPSATGNAVSTGSSGPQRINLEPDEISAGGEHSLVIGDSASMRSPSRLVWIYAVTAVCGALLFVAQRSRRTRTPKAACDEQPELPPYF